jgi:hypothetical protein
MFVQLYRSKVQFHRKFGGESRATHYKRLLRVAYFPRAVAVSVAQIASPGLAARARAYRRLLAELPTL